MSRTRYKTLYSSAASDVYKRKAYKKYSNLKGPLAINARKYKVVNGASFLFWYDGGDLKFRRE